MGSEMHVPKVRQKLYDRVDLIGECNKILVKKYSMDKYIFAVLSCSKYWRITRPYIGLFGTGSDRNIISSYPANLLQTFPETANGNTSRFIDGTLK